MKTGASVLIPEKAKPIAIPEELALLINISEVSLGTKERTYGMYTIPGRKKGEAYAKLEIKAARAVIDRGDNHKEYFIIHANEIAMDLARECNRDIWGIGSDITGELTSETSEAGEVVRGFAGVFLAEYAEGTPGFEAELEEARMLLGQSDEVLVARGHAEWDQFGRPDTIHEGFKRAARRLGVDAEWLYKVKSGLPDCPHCGAKLLTFKATVCATCGRDVVPTPEAKSPAGRKGQRKAAA